MMVDSDLVIGFIAIAAAIFVVGFIVYKFAKYGFKGALFNGRIQETVGDVRASEFEVGTTLFRVHQVIRESEHFVGLEIQHRMTGSIRIEGVPLSRSEAKALGDALVKASSAV